MYVKVMTHGAGFSPSRIGGVSAFNRGCIFAKRYIDDPKVKAYYFDDHWSHDGKSSTIFFNCIESGWMPITPKKLDAQFDDYDFWHDGLNLIGADIEIIIDGGLMFSKSTADIQIIQHFGEERPSRVLYKRSPVRIEGIQFWDVVVRGKLGLLPSYHPGGGKKLCRRKR